MAGQLVGRVVVAVGAGTRSSVVLAVCEEGATVVVAGPDGDGAGRILAAVEAAGRGRGAYFAGAAWTPDEAQALADFVVEQFGRLDVVCGDPMVAASLAAAGRPCPAVVVGLAEDPAEIVAAVAAVTAVRPT